MQGTTYQPDNSQNAQQFAINPFQRVEIDLVNTPGIDSLQGVQFPQLEGNSLYVERCDWPLLLTVIDKVTGIELSFVMRTGLRIRSPFKSATIRAQWSVAPAYRALASLIVGKGCADYANELGNSVVQSNFPFRTLTSTGIALDIAIYLPPGLRYLYQFHFGMNATTITDGALFFVDPFGNTIRSPQASQVIAGVAQAYGVSPVQRRFLATQAVVAGARFVANEQNIPIPSGAAEMRVVLNGTGFAAFAYDVAAQ